MKSDTFSQFQTYWHKYYVVITLVLLVALGAFLRFYLLPSGMHYELDQARDFRVIDQAVRYGPGELPLQGPKAAGNVTIAASDEVGYGGKTTLRLGPLFYYIEYISALIFGNTPFGSIVLIVLLSITTIPVFYIFARQFFEKKLSLGLTGLMSTSLFFVTYSRFGWNPNLMPLFMIGFAYCLLRATDPTETKNGWYLIGASASFAFLSNMHFLAFMIVPVVAVSYVLWVRPRIACRFWIGAIALFLFLNTPLIINDIKTGGENAQALIASIVGESSGGSLLDKLAENATLHTSYYWLVLTGDQTLELPVVRAEGISCDLDCRDTLVQGAVAALALLSGVLAWVWLYRSPLSGQQKNFLRFTALWWVMTFIVYIPLALDAAPRFFLLNAPLFLILLGFVIHAGFVRGKKIDVILGYLIISLAILINLVHVGSYYREMRLAQNDPSFELSHRDPILNEKTRVTYQQIEEMTDLIERIHQQNGYPVFVHAQAEYKRAIWERIDFRGIPRSHIPDSLKPIYEKGNYIVIIRTQSDHDDFLEKFDTAFEISQFKTYGTMTLYVLQQRPEAITKESFNVTPEQRDPRFSESAQPRYLWRQVFSGCRYDYVSDTCK